MNYKFGKSPNSPKPISENNNLTSSMNHNNLLPLLPKYPDPNLLSGTPYNLPLNTFPTPEQLRQFYLENTPYLPPNFNNDEDDLKRSFSSSEENLVIDVDGKSNSSTPKSPTNDFETVKNILETVNANLTRHMLSENSKEVEGLAAKLEEHKNDEGSVHSESGDESYHSATDDSRKVRVRSLFTDEQIDALKRFYGLNPRPNKKMLMDISEQIGYSVRVVRVWFQNTRARDRRENRPEASPDLSNSSSSPYLNPPLEEPLDLSIKKESYRYPPSISSPSGSYDDSFNMSQKSASPIPYPLPYQCPQIEHESRLAQILSQPSPKQFEHSMDNSIRLNFNSTMWQFGDKLNLERKLKCPSLVMNSSAKGEEQEQFICNQCDKGFSKQSSLARHKYEHSGKQIKMASTIVSFWEEGCIYAFRFWYS